MMGFVKGKSFLEIHAGNRIPQQILGTPAYITLYQIGFQGERPWAKRVWLTEAVMAG